MNISQQIANRINILLVDDNPDNLRLLSDMLLKHGYKTRKVISGQMALKAVEANDFDLIFLDINMPQMDGYEVCRQLKGNSKTVGIPVIFISALNEVLDKVKAFNVGGADYISKPFQFEEVIARVENQVQILNLQQELIKLNVSLENKINESKRKLEIADIGLKKSRQKFLKDPVTNLDNKISFLGNLKKAMNLVQTNPNYCFAVLVFNYYYIRENNEILDLKTEDAIAMNLAGKLTKYLSSSKTLARLRDNEFVTIIGNINDVDRAREIARKLQKKLNLPISFKNQQVEIKTHYGIALGNKNCSQLDSILQDARTLAFRDREKNK